jgi:tetratricopeptide (TPR) repeat protein
MSFLKRISWLSYAGKASRLYNAKKYDKALICAERALKNAEEGYNPEHLNVNRALFNLVIIHNALGEQDKAIECGIRAIEITEKNRGEDDIALIDDLKNILRVYENIDDKEKIKETNERIEYVQNKNEI